MENYIVLHEIGVTRDRKDILTNINLSVRQGATLAILGPNGAGKSTLLELLLGDNRPSRGTVSYQFDKKSVMRRRVGVLYNNQFIFPQLYVQEVLDFYKNIYRDNGAYMEELLDLFSVRKLLKSRVRALSEGEKKKLGAVLALFHKPELIVMDEPFANLDIAHIDVIWAEVKRNGATAVIATHEWDYAEKYADEFLFMDGGRILGRKFAPIEKNEILSSGKKLVVHKSLGLAETFSDGRCYEKDDYLHILLTPSVNVQTIRKHTLNYSILDISIKDIYQYLSIAKSC
jgi:ABC-2 type transport system ATP-binding protein